MRPIILDLDMGVDDALAMILALNSPELDVMGVSVVCGNVPLDIGIRNALQVLELIDRTDIPVYIGAEKPLEREPIHALEVHGAQGLGEAILPEPEMLPAGDAIDFLIQGITARPGEVILVAAGPLTNLALAEAHHPGILKKARRIFVMGGVLHGRGNVRPGTEYNFHADPHAARRVLAADANVTIVPLDVTEQVGLDADVIQKVVQNRTDAVADFISRASSTVIAYDLDKIGYAGLYLHDPLAVATAFAPELCSLENFWIEVTRPGKVAIYREIPTGNRRGKGYQVECAVSVDVDRFMKIFLHRVLDVS